MRISHTPSITSVDFRGVLQGLPLSNPEVSYGDLTKLLHESVHFFGAGNQKIGDGYSIFTSFAGNPHLATTDFIETGTYLRQHNRQYGTDISIPEMPTFPLHHVCWLTHGEKHFSWNDLCKQTPETRNNILTIYGNHIQEDIQFLTTTGDRSDRFHTTMAVGYSDDRGKKSAQSVRTIHVHNLKSPGAKNSQDIVVETGWHTAFLLQLRHYHIITHWNAEKIYGIFKESFNDKNHTGIRIQRNPENRFGKLTFECSSPSGMILSEVLDRIGDFYRHLGLSWQKYRTESISEEEKGSSFQKRVQSIIQAVMTENPSFNVILTWNEDYTRIMNISIAISPLGPAERINNALIVREKVECAPD